ncbi:hypothetical protein [uncultured Bacteroides sp.]|uniref:hypothetical protein n=1 Tax=uncultured Bacteroides sp. TaxID=162156 RepID=UPI0032B2D3F7
MIRFGLSFIGLLLILLSSCTNKNDATVKGRNDVGIDGLKGDVKKVSLYCYGKGVKGDSDKNSEIFYNGIPELVGYTKYDEYGRILEVYEPAFGRSEDGVDLYEYGDYYVPETDAIIKNVLLSVIDMDDTVKCIYEYDQNGLLNKIVGKYGTWSDNVQYVGEVTYDSENRIDKVTYKYDDGYCTVFNVLKKKYMAPTSGEFSIKNSYDSKKRLVKEEIYSSNDELVEVKEYVYQNNGMIKNIYSIKKGEDKIDLCLHYDEVEYDSVGNWIKGVDDEGWLYSRKIEYYQNM